MALAHRNGNIKLYRRLTLIDEIFGRHPLGNVLFNEDGAYLCCVCRSSELLVYETDSGRRSYIDASSGFQSALFISNTEVLGLCIDEKGLCVELFNLRKNARSKS